MTPRGLPGASSRGSHPCHLTCLQPCLGQAPCGTGPEGAGEAPVSAQWGQA